LSRTGFRNIGHNLTHLHGISKLIFPNSMSEKNIIYFDLETQKSAAEVGGWDKIRDMRMSVGVTYSTTRGTYEIYEESRVNELIDEIMKADLVIGFNHLRFDYEVLHGYTILDLSQAPSLDLMIDLQKVLNHRISLDAVATATLGSEKTAEGLQAIEWFKQKEFLKIAEYCCFDVKITKLVHEYGRAHKQVFYRNKFGTKMSASVDW
jgi:DEAD/DEAH box helicase domain-containing protein